MIIFLNGPSSSGKTSTAKAIQSIWPRPFLHMGLFVFMNLIDKKFIDKLNSKSKLGFYFMTKIVDGAVVQEFRKGIYGKKILKSSLESIKISIKNGNDVIIEEVISGKKDLTAYKSILKNQKVYFVGVKCPIETIEKRERKRKDRIPGQSRSVYKKVHPKNRVYDVEIDTSKHTPEECAKIILKYISKVDKPKSWDKLS